MLYLSKVTKDKSKAIKIYSLTGACATGKTTLVEHYSRKDFSDKVVIVQEAARLYYQKNKVKREKRSSLSNQTKLLKAYLAELKKGIKKAEKNNISTIITDCSMLSSYAYSILSPDKKTSEILLEKILPHLKHYDCFLLLNEKDVDYKHDLKDKVRQETEKERLAVQKAFRNVLKKHKLPHLVIKGNLKQRIKKINKIIKLFP
jgi:nicotinamide riboside kinase